MVRRICRLLIRGLALVAAAAVPGCLPGDQRPPAGRLVVTASADDALRSGFTTADGWRITYDEWLVSIGNVVLQEPSPDEGACVRYFDSEPDGGAGYQRILDMRRPEAQTVGTAFGLGTCAMGFFVRSPAADALLGAGVTEDDKTVMRTPASDDFVQNRGISLRVAGTAARADDQIRFSWTFRRDLAYDACASVTLAGGEDVAIDVVFRGAALMFDRVFDEAAEPRFDSYAAADANGDGELLLEELVAVPLPASDPFAEVFAHLAARLYRIAADVPRPRSSAPCLVSDVIFE